MEIWGNLAFKFIKMVKNHCYKLIGLKYHRGSILCKLHKVLMEITGGEVFQATKHFDIFNIIDNLK